MMDTRDSLTSANENHNTTLHEAVKQGNQEVVDVLLLNGADVNAEDEFHKPPLIYAIENTDLIIARLLLTNRANIKDIKILNTAVAIALEEKAIEIVQILLEHGADVNATDEYGRTALHFTALNKYDLVGEESDQDIEEKGDPVKGNIAKLLLSKGANVDAETKSGETALHIATQRAYKCVVEALLEYNANVNARTKSNIMPLHNAASQQYYLRTDTVKILLKHGAEVNATLEDGRTALHFACELGYQCVVKALLQHGSDINMTDRQGHTPLEKFLSAFHYLLDDADSDGFYYDCERAVYSDEDVPGIFKRHMLKMKNENLYLNEKNLLWLIRASWEGQEDDSFDHLIEIEAMKSVKLDNGNVSLYDVLTKNVNQLTVYARNEKIVQVIESYDFKTKFPIYGGMIKSNFRRGVERKQLLEQGRPFFCSFFDNIPVLPYNCSEKILSYLSDTDLKKIIECLNVSKNYNEVMHAKRPKLD